MIKKSNYQTSALVLLVLLSSPRKPRPLSHSLAQAGLYTSLCCCHCCVVTKLCLTLCNPMECSPLHSSVHGISQARILQWVAISSSRGSSQSRDHWPPALAHRFFAVEPPGKPICHFTLLCWNFPCLWDFCTYKIYQFVFLLLIVNLIIRPAEGPLKGRGKSFLPSTFNPYILETWQTKSICVQLHF